VDPDLMKQAIDLVLNGVQSMTAEARSL